MLAQKLSFVSLLDAPHRPDQHLMVQGWVGLNLQLGEKVNWAVESLWDPAAALSPPTADKTALLSHGMAIMAHLVCKQFTKYPSFVWCSFRDFLLKLFPQTRCLKEQVQQHRD